MGVTVDLVLKCTFAVVYAAAGALIGGAFVFVSVKFGLLFLGTEALSVKAIQALVIGAAAIAGILAAIGYLRQR